MVGGASDVVGGGASAWLEWGSFDGVEGGASTWLEGEI